MPRRSDRGHTSPLWRDGGYFGRMYRDKQVPDAVAFVLWLEPDPISYGSTAMARCHECGAEIPPGAETLIDVSWDEGIPEIQPLCPICAAKRRELLWVAIPLAFLASLVLMLLMWWFFLQR